MLPLKLAQGSIDGEHWIGEEGDGKEISEGDTRKDLKKLHCGNASPAKPTPNTLKDSTKVEKAKLEMVI